MRKMTNEEAIKFAKEQTYIFGGTMKEFLQFVIDKLERPQGEWYYNYQNGWHCSICHKSVKDMPTIMGKADFDFCPNCGADMRKEGQS